MHVCKSNWNFVVDSAMGGASNCFAVLYLCSYRDAGTLQLGRCMVDGQADV